jgi:hypothetical protein
MLQAKWWRAHLADMTGHVPHSLTDIRQSDSGGPEPSQEGREMVGTGEAKNLTRTVSKALNQGTGPIGPRDPDPWLQYALI